MEKFIEEIVQRYFEAKNPSSEITDAFIGSASRAIENISDGKRRDKCYKDLALTLAKECLAARALEALKKIKDPDFLAYAQSALAGQFAALCQFSQAKELIGTIKDAPLREDAIVYLIKEMVRAGEEKETLLWLQKLADLHDKKVARATLEAIVSLQQRTLEGLAEQSPSSPPLMGRQKL